MTQGEFFDRSAEGAKSMYQLYLGNLVGELARILDAPNAEYSSARANLAAVGFAGEREFHSWFERFLVDAQEDALRDAMREFGIRLPASTDADLGEVVQENADMVMSQVAAASMGDRLAVERSLRQFALSVSLKQAGGMSRVGAILTSKAGHISGLKFKQADRGGRNWKSGDYVETTTRAFFVRTFAETWLYFAATAGHDLVIATKPDESLVFSITGRTLGFPTYDEIRDEWFHPNSVAQLSLEPPHVPAP